MIGQLTIFREYIGPRKFNETTTWALYETNINLEFEYHAWFTTMFFTV